MSLGPGYGIMGCDMKSILFIIALEIFTSYMTMAAVEDFKTCQVTRWKHLIGLISSLACLLICFDRNLMLDYMLLPVFMAIFILVGIRKVYGLADGFVFANLTLLLGGIGGLAGVGAVIILMIVAAFLYLIFYIGRAVIGKAKLFENTASAFIPYIYASYIGVVAVCVSGIVW